MNKDLSIRHTWYKRGRQVYYQEHQLERTLENRPSMFLVALHINSSFSLFLHEEDRPFEENLRATILQADIERSL